MLSWQEQGGGLDSPREEIMGIGCGALRGAWLLVAILVGGCASRTGSVNQLPSDSVAIELSLGQTTIGADEMRELQTLPDAEQRRRLDVVLASRPGDLGARFLRTQAELLLKDDVAVVADSELVLANPSLGRRGRQQILEWRGEALLRLRRFDEAIAVANQTLEMDASSATALFTRGWARHLGDHPDGALADLDRALQIDPDEGIGYNRRAVVLQAQGQLDRAARDFDRAIALAPDDGPSHREYGALLYQTHDLRRALAQFDVAVRLMPDDPFALTWRAQTHLALGRIDAAAADDTHANELGAGDDLVHALTNVAVDLEDQQDFEGAARVFARSLALKFDPPIACHLARMQWFSGQFGPALKSFREHAVSPTSSNYTPLWLFVMRGRADPTDEPAALAELAAHATAHQPHAWTDTLVDLLLGKETLGAALAEADTADTHELQAGRRCEADYYAAEQLLMHGKAAPASRLLEEAHGVCPSNYAEAQAVLAERRLLAGRSSAR